jgi:hypothetical protein
VVTIRLQGSDEITADQPEGAKHPRGRSSKCITHEAQAGSNQFIANRLEISAMQERRGLWKWRDIPFVSHKKSAMTKRTSQSSDPGPSAKTSRFQFASDDNDFQELSRGYVPQNTSADTQKCLKLF